MQLINDIKQISTPFKNAVITIGNFDGVHIGHQSLFHAVIEKADAIGGQSVAITFEPHPARVLKQNGHPPLITLYEQKVELIESSGIDVLICIPFTKKIANLKATAFIEDLLIKKIGMKAIIIGKDYTFGKDREGNLELLKKYSARLGFELITANWIEAADNAIPGRISSTRIRELVMDGNVTDAQKLLGRSYQIRGTVKQGRDRGGKILGFPTANIHLQDELCPKIGVYAVTLECQNRNLNGVANIGFSPTFDDHEFTVEVHIFDFNEDIYGQTIRVNFIQRIRDEKKFANISELSEQIKKDAAEAREILAG